MSRTRSSPRVCTLVLFIRKVQVLNRKEQFLLEERCPAQRRLQYTWSVCLSARLLPRATNRPKSQRVQRYTGLILKMAIFQKILRSKVMAWEPSERANMLISTGLPKLGPLGLCILKAQEVTTKDCIDSCELSTTFACVRLSASYILAGHHEYSTTHN